MSGQEVARVQTLCAPADLYVSLRGSWSRLVQDSVPKRESVLVLLAHWALETGFGHACWNWNIGNKKRLPGLDYYYVRCSEILGGKEVWYDPPNPSCAFASFYEPSDPKNMDRGVDDYFGGLRGSFRSAWPAVVSGDPVLFCHLLKLARYYTADESLYTSGVVRCYRQLDAVIPFDAAGDGGIVSIVGSTAPEVIDDA